MSAPVGTREPPARGEPGWRLTRHAIDVPGVGPVHSPLPPGIVLLLVLAVAAAILLASWVLGAATTERAGAPATGAPTATVDAAASIAVVPAPGSSEQELGTTPATLTASALVAATPPEADRGLLASGAGGPALVEVSLDLRVSAEVSYVATCPVAAAQGIFSLSEEGSVLLSGEGTGRGSVALGSGAHRLEVVSACPWRLAAQLAAG